MLDLDLKTLRGVIERCSPYRRAGRVRRVNGLIACSLRSAVGDLYEVVSSQGNVLAEVIGFDESVAYLAPYEPVEAIEPGMLVLPRLEGSLIPSGEGLCGRVLDGLGRPMDHAGDLIGCTWHSANRPLPSPMERGRILEPFVTGQRAVDGLLTCGRGQRIGIFAGSGVGKSTLLGEIARGAEADVNVIALIGERSREVRPFLEDYLGEEGLRRSVVVTATCDQTPLMRVRAAQTAIAIAELYREQGRNVLFLLDSLTRLAMAQREMGLALGEPPTARGYTPSVFQLLARTVERLGNGKIGSITAILTVLVDGDDLDEPISDAVRSLVDGHIVLDRRLAERGHYPAINIGRSVSRIAHDVTDRAHQQAARKMRAILAAYTDTEDLIRVGAYARGSSPIIDRAIDLMPAVEQFLRQDFGEHTPFTETAQALAQITSSWPF